MEGGFSHLGDEVVHRGRLISLVESRHRAPDGTTFERDVVRHPGAVSVVPLDPASGEVVLVRQYRAAIDAHLYEIPAGKRDVADEEPEVTAERELVEEVGLLAGRLELLAEFYNSPGFCDEHSFVFLGTDLRPVASDLQGVEEQHLTVHRVPLSETPQWMADGRITDAKTIIGLTLTLLRQH